MPIRRLLKNTALGPEEVATVSAAFEGACKALGLTDRTNPVAETVATAVLRAAEVGGGTAEQIQQRASCCLLANGRTKQRLDRPNASIPHLYRQTGWASVGAV